MHTYGVHFTRAHSVVHRAAALRPVPLRIDGAGMHAKAFLTPHQQPAAIAYVTQQYIIPRSTTLLSIRPASSPFASLSSDDAAGRGASRLAAAGSAPNGTSAQNLRLFRVTGEHWARFRLSGPAVSRILCCT